MALHYNRVILIGNLTDDPDINKPGDTKVANFDLAINRNYKQNGEWKEETTYINGLSVWGYGAETMEDNISKGNRVFLEGRLKQDEWENDAGEERSRLSVQAEKIIECDRDQDGSSSHGGSSGGSSSSSGGSGGSDDLLDDPGAGETEDDIPF